MDERQKNPLQIEFWEARIADGTLIDTVKAYPEYARNMFGAIPTMRADIFELSIILSARKLLATPIGTIRTEGEEWLEKEISALIETLSPGERKIAEEALNDEHQDALARQIASRVIEIATGFKPTL